MKLRDVQDDFEALGLGVAAITYDSAELQRTFLEQTGMHLTLLQDVGARHVNAYGIRNEAYPPGHQAYGIPHPGILLIAPDGTVLGKWAEPGYRQRPAWSDVLAEVAALLEAR